MTRPKGSKNKVPWALKKAGIERMREEDARDPDLVAIREFLEREEPVAQQILARYRNPVEDVTEFVKAVARTPSSDRASEARLTR